MTGTRTDQAALLSDTLDLLYDAAGDAAKWNSFLAVASSLFNARGAQIGHLNIRSRSASFIKVYGYQWDESVYGAYGAMMEDDPWLSFRAQTGGKAMHCRMSITTEELHASTFYKDMLQPVGVEYTLGVRLHVSDDSISYFIAMRPPEQEQFTEADCALLDELAPHLKRALTIHSNLTSADLTRSASNHVLNTMAVGFIILDQDGRIQFANPVAQSVLHQQDGLFIEENKLAMANGGHNAFQKNLQNLLLQARDGQEINSQVFKVHRTNGRKPYNVFVTSFTDSDRIFDLKAGSTPKLLITINDPQNSQEIQPKHLIQLYQLTPAQAQLVHQICQGLSIKEAAQAANIKETSARQYIKVAFQKMGVNRQGELVREVLSIPQLLLQD